MTNVNFKVLNIEKAMKKDCVVVTLTFDGSDRQFTYVRRAYGNTTVIDGCRIYFDANYQVEKVEREYETKGVKKMSTAKQVGTTSSKIKNELEGKGIEIRFLRFRFLRLKRVVKFTMTDTNKLSAALNVVFRYTLRVLLVLVRITQLSRLQTNLVGTFTSPTAYSRNTN